MARSVHNQHSWNLHPQFVRKFLRFVFHKACAQKACAYLLGYTTNFTRLDSGRSNLTQNRGLACIYMSQNTHNWRSHLYFWFLLLYLLDFYLFQLNLIILSKNIGI
jgi:hypothetical protein